MPVALFADVLREAYFAIYSVIFSLYLVSQQVKIKKEQKIKTKCYLN